jgi:hypothetical protein
MVWYDATRGRLLACARQLVGQSLAPADLTATYERICGDFWYYALRTLGKLARGDEWAARYEFTFIVTGLLHALLRIEAGATDRWRASEAAVGIERVLTPGRLAQLNRCIPAPGLPGVRAVLAEATTLAAEVCVSLHERHGWAWPQRFAERVRAALSTSPSAILGPNVPT